MKSVYVMGIYYLLVLFMAIWKATNTLSPTERSVLWITCKECKNTTNATVKWKCRYGCDRYIASTQKAPASITRPTPLTSNTAKGSYLDCKKCYGHGVTRRDPRCKYGCGRFMTYPPTYKSNSKQIETNGQLLVKNVIEKTQKQELFIENKTTINKKKPFRYQYFILVIGLCTVLSGIIIGVVYHKQKRTQSKTAAVVYAADNVAVDL